jgi:hypothetical protein
MPFNRLPRVMKHYSPTGRALKRLLDTWDRNGSTSGLTAWQIYDDDDGDENQKCNCKNNIKLIYLTLYTVHVNLKNINNFSLVLTMNKLSLTKSINILMYMKNIRKALHFMSTCVLRRPIVFLRVRSSIFVRCNILILSTKTVLCSVVRCNIVYCNILILLIKLFFVAFVRCNIVRCNILTVDA